MTTVAVLATLQRMKLNTAAISYLRALIRAGHVDRSSPWSFTASDGNALLGKNGDDWSGYAAVHLGIDTDAKDKTKKRYAYPCAKKNANGQVTVYLGGLRGDITRGFQNGATDIAHAAQRLLAEAKGKESPKAAASVMFAALASDLSINPDDEENELQLFPDGEFKARDGRPANVTDREGKPLGLTHWIMNAAVAKRLIDQAEARKTPYMIDYEHQTLRTEKNGQPVPAAGWFQKLIYRPGKGLFAKVQWTERAKRMIAAREYLYSSPLFAFDAKTGEPTSIINAGLTNNPALDGMDVARLAAASFQFLDPQPSEEPAVNLKEKLIALLGLDAAASDEQILAATTALNDRNSDLEGQVNERDTQIAALNEQIGGDPDPKKYVSVDVVETLKGQIADLTAKHTDREVEDVIQAALNDERGPLLLEGQLDWARQLGKSDLDALKQYLDTATPIAALRGTQTGGKPPKGGDRHQVVTEESKEILVGLGFNSEEIKSMSKETA